MKRLLYTFSVLIFLLGCGSDKPAVYQGYVEGDFISVSPSVSGRIEDLFVEKGGIVEAGQLVYMLDSSYEQAALIKAQAQYSAANSNLTDALQGKRPEEIDVIRSQLARAKAQQTYSAAQFERDEAQYKSGTITRARYDQSKAAAESDRATVAQLQNELLVAGLPAREDQIKVFKADIEAAQAAIGQAKWNLEQKSVHSPVSGAVTDLSYRKGEWVSAGAAVIRVLPPENIKIRFFVPQDTVAALVAGQEVFVKSGGESYPANIIYISSQAEYTPPVIYSNDTRSKLTYMIEAKPVTPEKLHPGQPVEVNRR